MFTERKKKTCGFISCQFFWSGNHFDCLNLFFSLLISCLCKIYKFISLKFDYLIAHEQNKFCYFSCISLIWVQRFAINFNWPINCLEMKSLVNHTRITFYCFFSAYKITFLHNLSSFTSGLSQKIHVFRHSNIAKSFSYIFFWAWSSENKKRLSLWEEY